jgi:hypothetical protein
VTKEAGLPGVESVSKRMKGKGVEVGILAGTGEHPQANKGQTLAEIAFWNELGAKKGKPGQIPSRPAFRLAMWKNRRKYRRQIANLLKGVLTGKITSDTAHAALGFEIQKDIQQSITDLVTPPNAAMTKERKGSANPLIDIGALRQHITWGKIKRGLV